MSKISLSPEYQKFLPDLTQACEQLGLPLNDTQHQQLLYYLQQLLFWNKAYNLTAIKDPAQALIKHIFDSLSIVPCVKSQKFTNLLDVGTGAGLPAVMIAICCPDIDVTALDSNGKKIRFIKQVASELALQNIMPTASRIEEHNKKYSAITSRAFASLIDFVDLTQDKLVDNGQILAMKGVVPVDEMAILEKNWHITTQNLDVPQLNEERHLIVLKQ